MNFEFRISNFESISNVVKYDFTRLLLIVRDEITTSVQRGASVSDILNSDIRYLLPSSEQLATLKIRNSKLEIVLPGGQK